MAKQTFTLNDFSGGANGYVDPLDIADNELAQCQGFKAEPGTVIVLGDMKGAYTPSAATANTSIEPGYGLFTFAHDYDKDGDLNTTQYVVLMDGITFNVYDDDGDAWLPKVTGTTYAAVDSNPDTITDSGNGFITAGFKPGMIITVSGSSASGNNTTHVVDTVAAGTLTLSPASALTADGAGDTWTITGSQFNLGTAVSDASFAGNIKPCFFIADGALRVSSGNFTAKDNGGEISDGHASKTVYGDYHTVAMNSVTASDHVSAGDTIVVAGQELIVLRVQIDVSPDLVHVARNMTGTFSSAMALSTTSYSVLDTRWRGVVKRRNFPAVTYGGTFTEWYSTYSHPRPPVLHSDAIDHDNVTDYTIWPFLVKWWKEDAGNATNDNIGTRAGTVNVGWYEETGNDDATWDGANVNLYITALYDDAKQESHPHKYAASTITIPAATELAVWIGVEYFDSGGVSYRLNKRVTGARLYYEDTSNDPGILYQLLEIDFEKGVKKAEAETFSEWVTDVEAISAACPTAAGVAYGSRTGANVFIFAIPPKAFTYEFNNGYPSHVNTHARYKTAVVANRRLFVGNVYQSGKADGDRMISSPVNQFDKLPEYGDYIIDVTKGDGDEIVKLEAYADRILQFKKRTLYIINIGGGLGEEFLESQHRNMGVENPSQTCMTEYGVAWANSNGVFLYDGQEITDLTLNKLQLTNTTTADRPRALNIIEANIPIIGYHPDNKWLTVNVASNISAAFEAEAWIYDFKNGSWAYSQEFSADADYKTNMVWTPDNNLVFAAGTNSSNTPDFFKYRDSSANVASGNLLFLTKDFNLDAPGVKKKLRSVYITYSAAANTKIEADIIYKHVTGATTTEESLVEAGTDGSSGTYYTNANGFLSTGGSLAAPNKRTVELVPATPVTNAYTFQLKLHAPDADYVYTSYFKLYNISFVYRPLGTR